MPLHMEQVINFIKKTKYYISQHPSSSYQIWYDHNSKSNQFGDLVFSNDVTFLL